MTIVIDTNVMLPLFSANSRHGEIVRALVNGQLIWAVSQSVMSEYEEIITERSGRYRWQQVQRVMSLLNSTHDNILWVSPAYQFQVIRDDPDDNKFIDCAITAAADYVITEDGHFQALAGSGYKPQPVTPADFIIRHLTVKP